MVIVFFLLMIAEINPLYTNIYYEGIGHMGLCDLSIASPLLSSVLSGEFQKVDAYAQLKMLNEDCLKWLARIEIF